MGLSRNKVAVPEGAAGSPPFYGVFSGRWFVVRRVAHASGMFPGSRVGVLVWKRSLASLVPLGPAGSGVGMLLGSRTATRDVWSRAVFRMPLAGRRRPCGPRAGSCRGAWWFENWIVDASNAMNSVSSFALSRFRQALLFWMSLVSRSIVL